MIGERRQPADEIHGVEDSLLSCNVHAIGVVDLALNIIKLAIV